MVLLRVVSLVALLVIAAVASAYWLDLRSIRAELAAGQASADTPLGQIAYARSGEGPAVLIVHGAGGGHDQGRLLAEAFLPQDRAWIAPSRFGYPGSPMPVDGSTAAQGDALAALLDALGIEQVVVLAMSGGAPPALQFALRHPRRCRGLVLLSMAPYAPLTAEAQQLPVPIWLYEALFASDLPYWLLWRGLPSRLLPLFDVRPELQSQMTPRERGFVNAMLAAFLPVSARREGLRNEAAAIDPGAPIEISGLVSPVLVIHARDDVLAPFATARHTLDAMPTAEWLDLPQGGHLLLGQHARVRERIARFLLGLDVDGDPAFAQ